MFNSINTDLRVGENTIEPISFFWKAFFSDGSILEQFENNKEHRFQEVIDNFDKLIRFSLVNKDYSQCFTVDLEHGFIIYNNFKNLNIEKTDKQNIRLIYFRRRQVKMSMSGKIKSHNINYHLGIQWQDSEKRNHKAIFIIDKEGNWYLETE